MASIINLIKQHDISSLASTDELTFIYPFIVSKSIDTNFAESLRSFMMVQYLSQIKLTNAIKVTTSLASTSRDANILKVDPNKFNQQDSGIKLSIQGQDSTPVSLMGIHEDISVDLTKQEFIDKFRNILVNLVKTEPKFKQLNPMITTLVLENLLSIPIIAASKVENISDDVLYWILFAAMGQKIKLDSTDAINRVEAVLRHIPKDSYSELLNPEFIKQIEANNKKGERDDQEIKRLKFIGAVSKSGDISKYVQNIRDPMAQAFYTFEKVLDIGKWDENTGITSSMDTTLSAATIATLGSSQAVITNTNALFASLMSNYVLTLIQSTLHSVASNDEINVSAIITTAANTVIDDTNSLITSLMQGLVNAVQSQTISSSDVLFKTLEKSCKANSQINISNLLTKLSSLSFSVRGDTNALADFSSGVVEVASAMTPLSKMIQGFIDDTLKYTDTNLTGADINSEVLIKSYRDRIESTIIKGFKTDSTFTNKYEHIVSRRFGILTGGNRDASKFISTISSAISEITKFMALYTFYSYFCEYTGELASEVEVKRQGVMSFPNYCLVLPIETLRSIYAVLSARNFSNLVNNPDTFDSELQVAGRVSEFKLVGTVANKLGLRNIMVIDGNTVYYKWMFSNNVQKITKSTLANYVTTQTEFLKAY